MQIKIATSQFPISADIAENEAFIIEHIKLAKANGATIVHFPEASLSGYAGVDFASFDNYDWADLKQRTQNIIDCAKKHSIWLILGSAHPLTGTNKPHNSLYIINDEGAIVDRYDKLFCAGDDTNQVGDLAHYNSGNHFTVFEINGFKCGVLICHDYRYPELYRVLKTKGVDIVFHSYHAGNMDADRQAFMEAQINPYHDLNFGKTYPEATMPPTMVSYAANNYVWISCSNTAAKESCWANFVVRPDGIIINKSEKNKADLLITTIDKNKSYYDSTQFWRARAIKGQYYSGDKVIDKRSDNRHEL